MLLLRNCLLGITTPFWWTLIFRRLLLICRLLRNKPRACFLTTSDTFLSHNRHTTDGRQVHAGSVDHPSLFLFVYPLSVCPRHFLVQRVSWHTYMKVDEKSEILARLGSKNKAEKGRHMRTRLVQKLESKSEIKPSNE